VSVKKLIKVITQFYQKLYEDEEGSKELENRVEEEDVPGIMESEVEGIVESLKMEKAPEIDKITNEIIKYGGEPLIKKFTEIYNEALYTRKSPRYWKMSEIIMIFKKGNRHKIENYRPISLGQTTAKIYSKVIAGRLKHSLEEQQPREQAGFRRNYSTIDNLHTINQQIIEKSDEYNQKLYLAFIDYKEAFDSIKHQSMIKALENQGVHGQYVEIINEMYTQLKAKIKTEEVGRHST